MNGISVLLGFWRGNDSDGRFGTALLILGFPCGYQQLQTKMLLDKIGQTYSLLERCAKSANVFLVVCETGKGLLEIFLNGKGAVHIRHSK